MVLFLTNILIIICYIIIGDNMQVKIIDENHEKDLEASINLFLMENTCDIIDIKYQVAITVCGEDQIYCFSAMIVYC